jgi:hypothetical protein
MKHSGFHKLCLSLWGERWRPELLKLLASHGQEYRRRQLYNWQHDKTPVPEHVAVILKNERKRRKQDNSTA